MFISLSRAFGKFGKFRLGFGLRITKSNAIWMLFIVFFVWIFQLMWYSMLLCFWLTYAFCYGIFWCIKKLVIALRNLIRRRRTA